MTATSFSGNGSGLANLDAASLASGALPDGRLVGTYSLPVIFSNGTNSFSGTFAGSGAGLTGVVPSDNSVTTAKILDSTIADADISVSAAIADTKLATIATAGKVADSALSANVTKLGSSIESSEITDGTIADADINGTTGISGSKIIGGDLQADRLRVGSGHTLTGNKATIDGGTNNNCQRLCCRRRRRRAKHR